jgi:hypothetical protein
MMIIISIGIIIIVKTEIISIEIILLMMMEISMITETIEIIQI